MDRLHPNSPEGMPNGKSRLNLASVTKLVHLDTAENNMQNPVTVRPTWRRLA